MIEEFGSIIGVTNLDNILIPPLEAAPIALLDEILGILYKVGTGWAENNGFDLHALVDYFSKVVDEECHLEALAITTLASFFLIGDFSEVDVMVHDVVGRMDKENHVPMILGEILNGHDDVKEGGCIYFKQRPLLLQV
jgi:hypothetical protein